MSVIVIMTLSIPIAAGEVLSSGLAGYADIVVGLCDKVLRHVNEAGMMTKVQGRALMNNSSMTCVPGQAGLLDVDERSQCLT